MKELTGKKVGTLRILDWNKHSSTAENEHQNLALYWPKHMHVSMRYNITLCHKTFTLRKKIGFEQRTEICLKSFLYSIHITKRTESSPFIFPFTALIKIEVVVNHRLFNIKMCNLHVEIFSITWRTWHTSFGILFMRLAINMADCISLALMSTWNTFITDRTRARVRIFFNNRQRRPFFCIFLPTMIKLSLIYSSTSFLL